VYRALALGEDIPDEVVRWRMAETFGWTLEYIDSLPMAELIEYMSVMDGKSHASTSIIKR
jgi:hypothetical protein